MTTRQSVHALETISLHFMMSDEMTFRNVVHVWHQASLDTLTMTILLIMIIALIVFTGQKGFFCRAPIRTVHLIVLIKIYTRASLITGKSFFAIPYQVLMHHCVRKYCLIDLV